MRKLAIVLFMFSTSAFADITTVDEKNVPESELVNFVQVRLNQSQLFGNQFQANQFCNQFQRQGLNNFCAVRGYNNSLFGGDYNFIVQGRGRTRLGALNAVLDFLNDFNLILDQVQLIIDFFGGDLEPIINEK